MKITFLVVLNLLLTTSLCLANEHTAQTVQHRASQQKILDQLRVSDPKHRHMVRRETSDSTTANSAGLNLKANLNKLRKIIK